jgi:transcription initiation factor TFIIA large subunit
LASQDWRSRISAFRVADLAWDAKPPPVPEPVPKVEDVVEASPAGLQPQQNGGVQIKTEPAYEGYSSAQDRAANILKQQYGQQAAASISQIQQQSGFAMPGQQRAQSGFQMPGQQPQQRTSQMPQNSPAQIIPPLSEAQIDGGADYSMPDVANNDALRRAADGTIRAQIRDLGARLDNGLMVPLAEHRPVIKVKREVPEASATGEPGSSSAAAPRIPQMDGEDDLFDDDDVKDEDAINSDLDDSEDDLGEVDDEDEDGAAIREAILCTYDKVQR